MEVRVDGVSVRLGHALIIADIEATFASGQMVGVLGPNGSGKTTLLRSIYRALRAQTGHVLVGGDDLWALPPRDVARRLAVVVQEPQSAFRFRAREVVAMGRSPHKGAFERDHQGDRDIVEAALARVGCQALADRPIGELSGGERQRVLIARAIAQQAQVLVLDEPTNHLDVRYQLEVLAFVRELQVTALVAIHDINHAARFCDRVILMQRGRIVEAGPTLEVLRPDLLSRVFGVRIRRATIDGTDEMAFVADLGPAADASSPVD